MKEIKRIILAKINVVEEVDKQKNMGVAYIEAMIYISIGFLLSATIA